MSSKISIDLHSMAKFANVAIPVDFTGLDKRAEFRSGVKRITMFELFSVLFELGTEFIDDVFVDVNTLDRDTYLTRVVKTAFQQEGDSRIEVSIGFNNGWCRPSMFEGTAGAWGELGAQLPTNASRTDKGEKVDT